MSKSEMPWWAWLTIWISVVSDIAWGVYGIWKINLVEYIFKNIYPMAATYTFYVVGAAGVFTLVWAVVEWMKD